MLDLGSGGDPITDPMRMLMFIDGLGSGGAQRQFSHLACGLARRGHRVTVAVYNDQDHFADEIFAAGIEIVRLDKPSRFSARPVIELGRLYRKLGAEVVIAFLRSPAVKAELARLVFPGMKVIVAERSAYPAPPLPLALRVVQSLHGLARFVTVNSRSQAEAMRREFPRLSKRVVTINNGIELPVATRTPAASERELRLLAISSLMPYKNSVRLAEALALLRDEMGLRVTLSWLGETFEGIAGYGAYDETCERIRALKLESQWHWLGVKQDVAPILAAHDALIHPSLFEGTSNAVCEAMASGLPVIAGAVADQAGMLGQTGAGVLFDPLDVRSMAEAIARFASLDITRRREMGRRGRAVIERHYSLDRMILAYESLARVAASDDCASPLIASAHHPRLGACAE